MKLLSGIALDPAYKSTLVQVTKLARTAATRSDFVVGFNKIWREGPFSHVRLSVAKSNAQELAGLVDQSFLE